TGGDVPPAHRGHAARRRAHPPVQPPARRSTGMTIVQQPSRATPNTSATPRGISLGRITSIELRKMLDTRSGFWTMASIALVSFMTTGMVILFGDREDLTYRTFASAISVPMSLILPIIAILSVTAEWSQRSGLTTFTLIPHR